jgi:hypothetical protein
VEESGRSLGGLRPLARPGRRDTARRLPSFGLSCSSIDPNTAPGALQKSLTIEPLTATVSANPTSLTTGESFTLTRSPINATAARPAAAATVGVGREPGRALRILNLLMLASKDLIENAKTADDP